jgi:ankyrin repeat protein
MSRTIIVSCGGQPVTVERKQDGKIVFHDYDMDTDLAMEALGMDMSPCLYIQKMLLEEEKRPGALNEELLNVSYEEGLFDILDKIPLLIFAGADINTSDASAMADASRQSRYKLMAALVKMGADPNAENGLPLTTTISESQYELLEFLLEHGANPDIDKGRPLSLAADIGDLRAVRILVEGGADPTVNDNIALAIAINGGNVDMFDQLLAVGATIPSDGFQLEYDTKATPEMIDRLFEEFDVTVEEGRGTLEDAVRVQRPDLVEALLRNGVPLEPWDDEIVELAKDQGYDEIVDLLEIWQEGREWVER